MSESQQADPVAAMLRLTSVRGPSLPAMEITRSGGVIGRSSACEVRLVDATVSRRHAEIRYLGDRWMLADLGGANGTWLNDVRIDSEDATPLAPGDRIGVGPWVLRVGSWAPTTVAMAEVDGSEEAVLVKPLQPDVAGQLAHHRLQLLMDCAGRINEAQDEQGLARSLLESVIEGTGYCRAALVRLAGDEEGVEILGSVSSDVGGAVDRFSRTLVTRASGGEFVTLAGQQQTADWGRSIADLAIHSAMCCPVQVDDQVAACLYLDARGGEDRVAGDAAGFCHALAQLGGLAMANLRRRAMQDRQRELDAEMAAAREAQQLMVPLKPAELAGLDYAVEFHPGRVASGDLFDVVELEEGRIAVMLGDVAGKGVGAAILMAAAQAFLHSALSRHACPSDAVAELNDFVRERSASNSFLTLWVGVFHPDGTLEYVDAGHGYWAHCHDVDAEMHQAAISPLVGALEDIEFVATRITIAAGDRIVLMTDGVPEQPDREGAQFGVDRIIAVLERTRTCQEDVVELLAAVRSWAGSASLADDTTVASVTAMGAVPDDSAASV